MSRIIANNIRHNDATADSLSFDSSARVGIGTSSPQASLHIGNGTGNGVEIGNNGTLQVIDRGNSRIEPLTVTAEHVAFSIARNTSTTLHDERARVTYDGLTFNGDTAAANALDDYEEGSWTPTINSGYTVTYDTNAGRYVKIGKQVAIWLNIDTNTISGTSSDTYAYINGLPFTVRNSGYIETGFAVGWQYQLANNVDHAYADGGQTRLVLLGPNSSGSRTHWNPDQVWANTTNDRRISISGVYWTDA